MLKTALERFKRSFGYKSISYLLEKYLNNVRFNLLSYFTRPDR